MPKYMSSEESLKRFEVVIIWCTNHIIPQKNLEKVNYGQFVHVFFENYDFTPWQKNIFRKKNMYGDMKVSLVMSRICLDQNLRFDPKPS